MVDEYSRLIREGHGERCPWRNAGCDGNYHPLFFTCVFLNLLRANTATIHRLPLTYTENAMSGLRSRYFSLVSLDSKLPTYESVEVPKEVDVDEIIKLLPLTFFQNKTAQDETTDSENHASESLEAEKNTAALENGGIDVNKSALMLALFGWDVGDAAAGLAGCGACFRRLGLWMYKPKDDGNVRVYNKLDVANEHLDYCPWVNPKTQSGSETRAGKVANGADFHSGWEILLRTIRNKHRRCAKSDPSESPAKEKESTPLEPIIVNEEARRAKDKEWWTRLRKVRQALNIKGTKKPKANSQT